MVKKSNGKVKRNFNRKWLVILLILLIAIYLNRSYAYFFDYLGDHEVMPPQTIVRNPYFYLPENSVNTDHNLEYFALGDSLTRGVGVDDDRKTYSYLIANSLTKNGRIAYVDMAIPGSTTEDLISNQIRFLGDSDPKFVTLMIGINDVLNSVGGTSFKKNYNQILTSLIQGKSGKIVVINIPYLINPQIMLFPYNFLVDWRTRQFNSIIEALVREKQTQGANIEYVDLYSHTKESFSTDQTLYSADKFHPNAKGYQLWSQIINENTNL